MGLGTLYALSTCCFSVTTPHAPYNVTVDTSQFSAKVTWLPAYDGGFPQHYILWYVQHTLPYTVIYCIRIVSRNDSCLSFPAYTLNMIFIVLVGIIQYFALNFTFIWVCYTW